MKKIIFFFLLWIPQLLFSQTQTIHIIDGCGKAIQYANINLFDIKDSTKLYSTVSDSLGSFQLNGKKGIYRLSVKCLGYEDYNIPILIDTLKTITLQEASFKLGEVVVHKSTLNRGNSLLINIENSHLSKLLNLSKILPYMPFVTLSNNNIEVVGRGTPIFFLNGHEARDINELLNIKGSDIKNIEIIISPGSEYDASVQSIIKITTKRRKDEGLGGNIDVSLFDLGNQISETTSNLLNYRKGSYDFFANINMRNTRTSTVENQISKLQLQNNKERKQHSDLLNKWLGLDGALGFDYIANKLSFGGKYTYTWTPNYVDNYDIQDTYKLNSNAISKINSSNCINRKTGIYSLESFVNYNLKKYLILQADNYLASSKDKTKQNINKNSNSGNTNSGISNGSYDYFIFCQKILSELNIGNSILKFGSEATITNYNTEFCSSIANGVIPTYTKSERKERTVATFCEFNTHTSFIDLTFGLRYEHSLIRYKDGTDHENKIKWSNNNLFPSISLKKTFGNFFTGLNYSVKIRRPNYQELRSNVEYYSPLEYASGNTSLKPCIIYDLSLLATYKNFNAILSFEHRKKAIIQTAEKLVDMESILYSPKNIPKYQKLSFALSWSKSIGEWTPFINTSIQKPLLEFNGRNYNSIMFSLSFNNMLSLKNGYIFYFDTSFSTGGHIMLYHYKPKGEISLGISKSFFKEKLDVYLNWTDVFKTNKEEKHLQFVNIDLIRNSYRKVNGIILSVSYKFNLQKNRYNESNAGVSERSRL